MASVQDVTGAATGAGGASNTASLVQDTQDRFLKLLVAQMQNQDPLNPLDNSQVTTQLAQLSTVDGINKLNTALQGLSDIFSQSRALQAASLVGRNVLAPGTGIQLTNGNAVGGVDLSQAVDKLLVTITDPAGNVQDTIDLGPQSAGIVNFHWDGTTASGGQAANGNYLVTVQASQAGNAVPVQPLTLATVGSVSLASSGTLLNTDSLGPVDLSQIKQVF